MKVSGRVGRSRVAWTVSLPAVGFVLSGVVALSGCGPTADPVGTPFDWWHQLEGGVVAEQRPPPPGVDDPYPHVGTTPARPVLPTQAARDSLTASLVDQRAMSHRLDTHDPIVTVGAGAARVAPSPGSAPLPGVGLPPGTGLPPGIGPGGAAVAVPMSATLDAAGQAVPAPNVANAGVVPQAASKPVPQKPLLTPEQQEASEPLLAMPPAPASVTLVQAAPLPQMPSAPPTPPNFSGFEIPVTELRHLAPTLPPTRSTGSDLSFVAGSDVILPDSRRALTHAASSLGPATGPFATTSTLLVHGYGDARSDTPADQEAALRLGLARAAVAGNALEALGVPQARIRLAAAAFGRGGAVEVVK